MKIKECTHCKEPLPVAHFGVCKKNKDGLRGSCKLCRAKYEGTIRMRQRYAPVIDLEGEYWEDVKRYEGYYKVSNYGRIKSVTRRVTSAAWRVPRIEHEKIMRQAVKRGGYLQIGLHKNGRCEDMFVHRVVAEAFIPNLEKRPCVNHINPDPSLNHVENLEWATYRENYNWSVYLGRQARGRHRYNAKAVSQYDAVGNFIRNFDTVSEAALELNTTPSNILRSCKDFGRFTKGYKWKYA